MIRARVVINGENNETNPVYSFPQQFPVLPNVGMTIKSSSGESFKVEDIIYETTKLEQVDIVIVVSRNPRKVLLCG